MISLVKKTSRPFVWRLLCWGVITVVLASLMAYVVSYYIISRRGIVEATADRGIVFFYVPVSQYCNSPSAREIHFKRLRFYSPLNWIDTNVFGGMPAARGGIRKLGELKEN